MPGLRTRVVTGVAVLVLAVAWFVAGPAGLGGTTTYVTTHGISMEPRVPTGDLPLVRRADQYPAGDVGPHPSTLPHPTVLPPHLHPHPGPYRFQGDKNNLV